MRDEVGELPDARLRRRTSLLAGLRVFLDAVLGFDTRQQSPQQRLAVLARIDLDSGGRLDGLDPAHDIQQRPRAVRARETGFDLVADVPPLAGVDQCAGFLDLGVQVEEELVTQRR
jgi:hypothetical protein